MLLVRPGEGLLAEVGQYIHYLRAIKRRIPLIKLTGEELRRRSGGDTHRVRNVPLLELLEDSFDMVVIDLASLREGLTNRGLFKQLEGSPQTLRAFAMEELKSLPEPWRNAEMLAKWNEPFRRLFPNGGTPSANDVRALVQRFRRETDGVRADRSQVRAHRYEELAPGGALPNVERYFLSLPRVEAQFEVFEQYLADIYFLVSRGTQYAIDTPYFPRPDEAANDLADLLLLGSIDDVTVFYGLVRPRVESGRATSFTERRGKKLARLIKKAASSSGRPVEAPRRNWRLRKKAT